MEKRSTKKWNEENVKLTSADIQNGWTAQRLADYLNEREEQQAAFALIDKPKQIKVENVKNSFDPHKWLT